MNGVLFARFFHVQISTYFIFARSSVVIFFFHKLSNVFEIELSEFIAIHGHIDIKLLDLR